MQSTVSGGEGGSGADEAPGAELRAEALAGGERSRAAFERLWRLYRSRLLVFSSAYRGLPAAEREDAVSDALIAAYAALGRYDPERPLTPWIYRIAANRFADATRRARRLSSLPLGESGEGRAFFDPPSPERHDQDTVERDLAQRCAKVFDALPDTDRRIAQLRFFEGLSSAEIARILGMSAGTVRWRVSAIRGAAAAALGELP